MSTIDAKSLLALRQQILERNAAFKVATPAEVPATNDFGAVLGRALEKVNEVQAKSGAMSAAFERGETTDIAAVMLQRQKSSIAFEATLQVRNKLLSAYKDIMNMPV